MLEIITLGITAEDEFISHPDPCNTSPEVLDIELLIKNGHFDLVLRFPIFLSIDNLVIPESIQKHLPWNNPDAIVCCPLK